MSSQLKLISRFAKLKSLPSRRFSSQVQKTEKPAQPSSGSTSETPRVMVNVSASRKIMFVFAGLFKSTKDIPDVISAQSMSKTMDKFRVRASLLLMLICAIGAVSSITIAKGIVGDIENEKDRNDPKK